jgi:hypothetical protein
MARVVREKFSRRFFDAGAFVAYIDPGREAKTSLV